MNRSIPLILGATAMTVPAIAEPVALAAQSARAASAVRTYYGPAVRMPYGPVQVGIRVSGTRIVQVWGHGPTNQPQCKQINNHAIPILDREALQAQSVRGVHKVSGASLTSFAFQASLARAMAQAHLAGA